MAPHPRVKDSVLGQGNIVKKAARVAPKAEDDDFEIKWQPTTSREFPVYARDPMRDFLTGLHSKFLAVEMNPTTQNIEEMQDYVKRHSEALVYIEDASLTAFLDISKGFTVADADRVVMEARALWPEIVIDVDRVFELGSGLRESETILDSIHLKDFLTVGCVPRTKLDADHVARISVAIFKRPSLIGGRDASMSNWAEMFHAIRASIERILRYCKEDNEAIIKSLGTASLDATLDEVTEALSLSLTLDGARLLHGKALSLVAEEMCAKFNRSETALKELLKNLHMVDIKT